MGKLAPRPYVDSALQLSKQKFKNLNNTEALIDILSKQQVRKVIPTASERDSKKEKSVEVSLIYHGYPCRIRYSFRKLYLSA